MIKRVAILGVLALFIALLLGRVAVPAPRSGPGPTGSAYIERSIPELGAQNVVTAIVVTWRGLDTLGEVSVLFLAAAGVALLLRTLGGGRGGNGPPRRDSSEILKTGADVVTPAIVYFGVYVFMGGHLTPGGGFQGGAVIASAVLLLLLAFPSYRLRHGILTAVESLSGAAYVAVGLAGLVLAAGFLDTRVLPLGIPGRIVSAGAIPLIYTLIGLKVGTELAAVIENLGGRR
jgi:multicomponent Na+:H+ antiporter subunit B